MDSNNIKEISTLKDTIVISPAGMFTNNPIPIEVMCNIFCAGLNGAVAQIREQVEANAELAAEDKKKIYREIFDSLNNSMSKCLEISFPEYELHPELSDEAMKKVIEKENEIAAARAKHKKAK